MRKPAAHLLFLLSLFMSACIQPEQTKKIFRMNQAQKVETLDPAFAKNQYIMWQVAQCYNRLIEFDSTLQPIPSLASSWTISADRKTYLFHLRNDVYFHDNPAFPGGKGRRMLASDVVYSFQRLLDAKTASPGAWVFSDKVDRLQPFVAANDSTFILHLQKPFTPMLGILGTMYCSVVPHEAVQYYGNNFRAHPCGTGPFELDQWEEGVAITYRRNPHYWETDASGRRLPYIDGLKFLQVDSKVTEFLLFLQGDLDCMNGIDVAFKDQVLTKSGELKPAYRKAFQLIRHPYLNVEYLGFLMDPAKNHQALLSDIRIRKAINYGFDRRKLVRYLRNNIGVAAEYGMIPCGLPGYGASEVNGYTYQPDKARQLTEAVRKERGTLPPVTLLCNDQYADRCTFIAAQLKEIGLTIELEIVQPSLLRERMSNRQADFFWATWIADYPDAEAYLALFNGTQPSPPNYTRFHQRAYDSLYEQSMCEADEGKRISLYRQMDQVMLDEAPCVPLFYDEGLHFLQNRVKDFHTNALNLPALKSLQLQP